MIILYIGFMYGIVYTMQGIPLIIIIMIFSSIIVSDVLVKYI